MPVREYVADRVGVAYAPVSSSGSASDGLHNLVQYIATAQPFYTSPILYSAVAGEDASPLQTRHNKITPVHHNHLGERWRSMDASGAAHAAQLVRCMAICRTMALSGMYTCFMIMVSREMGRSGSLSDGARPFKGNGFT